LGWEENYFGNGKVLRQRRVCENKSQLFVKPKSLLSRVCLHGYEHSGLQGQTVNRNIISGPLNIKHVKGKEIIILKVRDDVEMNSFTVPDDWFLKNLN
jgi:hypothetical protein